MQMRIVIINDVCTEWSPSMLSPTSNVPDAGQDPVSSPMVARTVVAPRAAKAQRIDSQRLLSGGRELVIEHAGQEYRLRLTRNDKLILTK
jgi:hemin uptake protein HemP